jgi:hypothetical protein
MAAVRASADHWPAVVGAVAAVRAAQIGGRLARLHVSGDFGANRSAVDAYCADLIDAIAPFGGSAESPVAWTYTHHGAAVIGQWLARLRDVGIAVRRSDYSGRWGAVVVRSFGAADMASARAGARLPVAKCRAQTAEGATCAECRLCWERPDVVIAFRPDGGTSRRIGEVLA